MRPWQGCRAVPSRRRRRARRTAAGTGGSASAPADPSGSTSFAPFFWAHETTEGRGPPILAREFNRTGEERAVLNVMGGEARAPPPRSGGRVRERGREEQARLDRQSTSLN